MVHLEKISEKTTPQLKRALRNAYEGLTVWPSAREFISAIEAELKTRKASIPEGLDDD